MLLLWNVLLTLFWPLLYFYKPFRGEIAQRLGRDLPQWSPVPATYLINAVSAGEVVAIAPFIRELKRRQPGCQVALLTTTDSGQEMARSKLADVLDLLAYFPLADLTWAARHYLDRLLPSMYITTESELWPNIQRQCNARGIPVVSLNARIYLHNKTGLRGALVRQLYATCDLIVCQSPQQQANFVQFGVPESKLTVSGNTKFDFELPEWSAEQLAAWRARLGLQAGEPVIVAGSTHPGEDELVLGLRRYLPVHGAGVDPQTPAAHWDNVKVIIAPRHIERAAEVVELAQRQGYSALTLSALEAATQGQPAPHRPWDVLVVDRYGVLVDFYRLANVVVMGGTFSAKVGGHNLLEATALGKPVVIGPYTFSIEPQIELLRSCSGVVEAGAELVAAVRRLLEDPAAASELGMRAQQATQASRGAAARAVDAVLAASSGDFSRRF